MVFLGTIRADWSMSTICKKIDKEKIAFGGA